MREAGSKISKKYSRYYFVTSPNNNECAIVTEQEINIMRKVDASLVYTMYRAGDIVVINAGPFKNFTGTISLVDEEKKTLDVDVDVFEKKVTVNRTYDQVELA
jgi:transcriptional antiterminator NusG